MELTVTEAAQRLGVSPRRVRALVNSGQLPAVRRGRMWLTTAAAVDAIRRNSQGSGRPVSPRTAWSRIHELAEDGDLPRLQQARTALRSRAIHRTYVLADLVARRLETPAGTFRSGLDVLDARRGGDPIDLYATNTAAGHLIDRTGATPSPEGQLRLHALPPAMRLPHLSSRERLVLAWCDLVDRDDTASDLAVEQLWPGSIDVPTLAEITRGVETVPYTELRGLTDWLERHPSLADQAIAPRPDPTGDPSLDSLLAAIAETIAVDHGMAPPQWAGETPPAPWPRPARRARGGDHEAIPLTFERRGIDLPRETFWRVR